MNREQVLLHAKSERVGAKSATNRGRLDRAREILTSVIDLLKSSLAEDASAEARVTTSRNEVARVLADTYGMLGGVERRRGALREALSAYASGCKLEQDPEFGIVDSYNLVNELVLKILIDPSSFGGLADELLRAAETVREQVRGPRRDQWWAWADAALLELLVGNGQAADQAYHNFAKNGPGRSGFTSVVDVLAELAVKLQADEPATAERLRAAAADVRSRTP
jgi:hypothetical protein